MRIGKQWIGAIVCLMASGLAKAQEQPKAESFGIKLPAQVSIAPGLSTNGKFNGVQVNGFSLNIFGGKNYSVTGVEVGGLFNIDAQTVKYVQVAGLFNTVGKDAQGVQVGGLFNNVGGNVAGVQVGGLFNNSGGNIEGVDVGGLFNNIGGNLKGLTVGGLSNNTRGKVDGMQVAGLVNTAGEIKNGVQVAGIFNNTDSIKGAQIAGLVNHTRKLKGVQIGLVNIADTSDGVSVGLVNIVKNGFYQLAVYADETNNANIAFKSGTNKFYGIMLGGANISDNKKLYSFGAGFGTAFRLGSRFSINPEVTEQYVYQGSWDYTNLLSKLSVNANFKITKGLTLFGGPSFAVYYSNQHYGVKGYKLDMPSSGYQNIYLWKNTNAWFGWTVGVGIL